MTFDAAAYWMPRSAHEGIQRDTPDRTLPRGVEDREDHRPTQAGEGPSTPGKLSAHHATLAHRQAV